MSNQKQTISFEEWKTHRKISKILSEEGNEEDPNIESVDAEITAWAAGSGKASKEADADIEEWSKGHKN